MTSPATNTPISPLPVRNTTEAYSFANTFIQRSRPYLTSVQIDSLRPAESQDEAREISTRLNACVWIVQVSRALQFPVRTMATAMIMFNRLLLFNKMPQLEHNWTEAAAAALFVACKIEDTLKKSKEILAASYNLRHPQSEPINPDSNLLEDSAKRVIGLERMVLETTSFDFRNRHAQPFLIKICRCFKVPTEIARTAWNISIDVYRTLAPLRSTPHELALASLNLAARLGGHKLEINYREFEAEKNSVLAIVDDLLELYTNHSSLTIVGPTHEGTTYLNVRIELNRERKHLANGHSINHNSHLEPTKIPRPVSAILSDRGTNGTIRFMIDPEREQKECQLLDAAPDGGMGRTRVPTMVNGGPSGI